MRKEQSKNYYVALLLSLSPLGWIGVHRFYLGKNISGFFYLLFSITLIPAILSIIDAFLLLKRGRESFIKKYGTKENLNEYYLQQLYQNNPELAMKVKENMNSDDKESTDAVQDIIDEHRNQ